MSSRIITLSVVLAIVWPCALYKLVDLTRNPQSRPLRALALTLITISTALALQPFNIELDRAIGILDFTRTVSNSITLASACAAQAFLLYMTGVTPASIRSVRYRMAITACAVVAILISFAVTPPTAEMNDPAVLSGAYYIHNPQTYAAVHVWIYLAVLMAASIEVGRLAWRYAAIGDRALLRVSLRTLTAAAGFSVLYCLLRIVYLVEALLDLSFPGGEEDVIYFYSACILLFLVGSTVPSWGPLVGLEELADRASLALSLRRLRPLWNALRVTDPGMVLAPTGGLSVRLAHVRLIIEINDFMRSVLPLASPDIVRAASARADAAKLTRLTRAAVIMAAMIESALHTHSQVTAQATEAARRSGLDEAGTREAVAQAVSAAIQQAEGDTVSLPEQDQAVADRAGEVRFLEQVSRALRSPVVASVLYEAAPAAPRPTATA